MPTSTHSPHWESVLRSRSSRGNVSKRSGRRAASQNDGNRSLQSRLVMNITIEPGEHAGENIDFVLFFTRAVWLTRIGDQLCFYAVALRAR